MKIFLSKMALFLGVALTLTACGSSSPSATDVLNAYKDWATTEQKLGQPTRPLPPEAIVDHCKKAPDQPRGNGVLFNCYIRFGGESDTNLNPIQVYRGTDGHWVHW
ncbi:hypothetical protein [Dyella mobilis]|uniref:Lipoprotein n=1 Tax=Dyella mobilis TaxID=1849582 RepID=A0ABS2KIU2_9GAMM|nr:hypothetical protein [Dyella mobilis]MBM7130994.1 hypothetical protein [Dyella mobilis]GLQ97622.1 hypothetical protein GCM10007863_20420 [Dyella mobilis]